MNPINAVKQWPMKLAYAIMKANWADQLVDAHTYNMEYLGGGLAKPAKNSFLVFKSVDFISKHVASIPLEFYVGDKRIEETNPYTSLFLLPNERQTLKGLIAETAAYYTLYGEAFWWMGREDRFTPGLPEKIVAINPRNLKPKLNEEGTQLIGWEYNDDGRTEMYFNHELIQFKNVNVYDQLRGASPLDAADIEIKSDYKAGQWNEAFYENNTTPSTKLTVPKNMSVPDMKKLIKEINQVHKGQKKHGKILVLKDNMKLEALGLNQREMDFINSRKFNRDNILVTFGIPKVVVGYTEGINMATAKMQESNYWRDTIQPTTVNFEDKINMFLLNLEMNGVKINNFRVKFNYTDIEPLHEALDMQVKTAKEMMSMGSTRKEVYKRFNFKIETDDELADKRFISSNLKPAEQAVVAIEPVKNVKIFDVTESVDSLFVSEYKGIGANFRSFFRKQRGKVLRSLNKSETLDSKKLKIIFDSEENRLFKDMESDIIGIDKRIASIFRKSIDKSADNSLRKEFLAEIIAISGQYNKDMYKILSKTLADSKDMFQSTKDIYNKIDNNCKNIGKEYSTIVINLMFKEYYNANDIDNSLRYYIQTGDIKDG